MLEVAPGEKITIQILNWEEYAGTSRAPFYFRLPMNVGSRWKDLSKHDKGVLVELLGAAGSDRVRPGVVSGSPRDISQALCMKTRGFLQATSRLIDAELIQIVTNSTAAEYRREEVKNRREGHGLFPSWIFDQVGLVRTEAGAENGFLTREIFGKGIFQLYPKPNPEGFERVFGFLGKIVVDDRWLAFTQTCLRNYTRRKRAESERPVYHNMTKYFLELDWWEHFRTDKGTIPQSFAGSGPAPVATGALTDSDWAVEHNISSQS